MALPDAAVFQDRDFKWYWRFKWTDNTTVDKSRDGYPTRAEAWRGVVRHLLSLLHNEH